MSPIELTRNGAEPITLPSGEGSSRMVDTAVLRGFCGGGGRTRIGLGDVEGTVI